ncbi:MAG: hypothetical protein US57_C0002G0034 [Candidatus Moranbacteria bacterium GW2011_GWC2_37_73]|nr:MAG: hypothetical protein UR95_C0002G0132 [Parcubacteria group bacterium GW2011_GWC1_36_108]KKQ01025.1 MAG: hypothetical protein US09_C0003G0025 [Candidatus Moranbacteria bacterium GW2011_GWD1_36_198]KKQ02427.1 MAG: hypothetical protein US10_C0001G0025 [Candidatus Moranbacteria bacterium GW2011_GWD2_36_198]KKQ40327.1 MAG: hypothetical protein US57_C0002G0034 [Candidatus Moranbacteria bacterium GW2011_GWC2_37_73]
MNIESSVGKKIRQLRKEKGLKQHELGTTLGLSESYISYVEKGARVLSGESLHKLIQTFNLGENYFSNDSTMVQFRADASSLDPECNYDKLTADFFKYAKSNINKK